MLPMSAGSWGLVCRWYRKPSVPVCPMALEVWSWGDYGPRWRRSCVDVGVVVEVVVVVVVVGGGLVVFVEACSGGRPDCFSVF